MQRCNSSGAEDLREDGAAAPFLRSPPAPQRAVLLENQSDKPRESEGRALSAPNAPGLLLACDALTLAHGVIPTDHDGVGVVYDAVADGVCEGGFADLGVPAGGIELRAKDRGRPLAAGFYDLQQIAGFRLRIPAKLNSKTEMD